MENKKWWNNGIVYLVVSLLLVAGAAGAYSLSQSVNVAGDYNYYEAEGQPAPEVAPEEPTLGATPGGDFYNPVTFYDSLITNGTINIDLNWKQATSSAVGATTLVLGKYKYAGPDTLVCSGGGGDTFVYIEGLVPYKPTYRFGTTTCATATAHECGNGTYSFTATTTNSITAAVQIATSTSLQDTYGWTIDADDNEGDYAQESFILKTNDWVLVTAEWTGEEFTTSTMPTLTTQGLTADGYAKMSCKKANK